MQMFADEPEADVVFEAHAPGPVAYEPDEEMAQDDGFAPTPMSSRASRPEPTRPAIGANALELSNLSADIAIGRVRIVLLAALTDNRDCDSVAETLIRDALRRGLSVVRVDGGSGRVSLEPGLSDLAADRASFGDVVHRVRDNLAEVPWGQASAIKQAVDAPDDSGRGADRYLRGRDCHHRPYRHGVVAADLRGGAGAGFVLVSTTHPNRATIEAAVEDAADLGFEVGQIVHPMHAETEVA